MSERAPQLQAPTSVSLPSDQQARPTSVAPELTTRASGMPVSPDEPSRAERLQDGGVRAAWEQRALWLESEANAQTDSKVRARLLLAASEVRALCGARTEARRLAARAENEPHAPVLALRQARALGHGDIRSAVKGLREEARLAKAPAVQAQAHYAAAELLRLREHDEGAAEPSLEAAEQSDPNDFRPTLQRLARQLGRSARPPEIRLRPDEGFRPLRQAVGQLAQLRGSEAPRLGAPDLAAIHLAEAQRAWSRGKPSDASRALAELESKPGLRGPIQWLLSLWQSTSSTEGGDQLSRLARIARESPRRAERRALAARALAAGNLALLLEALGTDTPPVSAPAPTLERGGEPQPAFSSSERLSLLALMGGDIDADPCSAGQADDAALAPLISALDRLTPNGPARCKPSTPAESEFSLGRAAARLQHFAEYDPAGELAETDFCDALLRLERARERGDSLELARQMPHFSLQGGPRAECSYLAAVWAERAGGEVLSRELYRLALPSGATREAAVRAISRQTTDSAAMFRSLSAHTSDPVRRSALLIEALFRLEPEAAEFDALAEEAARNDPEQPLSYHLAELAARIRGDRPRVSRWLARQRERARSSDDFALAAIREALFMAQSDPRAAASRLEEAIPYASSDAALRRRRERWVDIPALERAQVRRRAAESASSREREYLAYDAMTLYVAAGDTAAALASARELSAPLGVAWAERLATQPEEREWLVSFWKRELEGARDPELIVEIHERLAHVELARGEHDQAEFWQRERLKLEPQSLSALRFISIRCMAKGREAELEHTAAELSLALDGLAMQAHAYLAARLSVDRGAYADARPHVQRAASIAEPPLWALRAQAEYAREAEDHAALLGIQRKLREHTESPLDVVALSLRAAEAAAALGEMEAAAEELARARTAMPGQVVVLRTQAELAQNQPPALQAEALEALATATQSPSLRVDVWLQVAALWIDVLDQLPRGLHALERAAASNPLHPGVTTRVRESLARSPDLPGLKALAEKIRIPEGPTLTSEVARAGALLERGDSLGAREVIDHVLALHPRHAGALELSGNIHFRAGGWAEAERVWLDAVAAAQKTDVSLPVLRSLAQLYEGELESAERRRAIYSQILDREPDDTMLRRRLIRLSSESGDHAAAVLRQREWMERATNDEERRQSLLDLVELLEKVDTGAREAELLLERAQRTWPENASVLRAAVEHYQRRGDSKSARVISERATNAARNAIQAGRIEASLFQTLEVAARLAGDTTLARLARAALAAIHGQPSGLGGAGAAAGDPSYDELLAPPQLSSGLRRFLYEAGSALERTYAIDPHVLAPRPLPEAEAAEVQRVASAFGLAGVRVLVSDEIGFDCVYLSANPDCLIFGAALIAHDNVRARDFALLRALKLAQANSSALAHMPGAELWAAVAGFLACFAPPWPAQGADAQRLVVHRNKIRPHVTATLGPELSALAGAVTANVVPQAAQIGDALARWASRVALLGVGDVGSALEALFRSSQRDRPLPKDAEGWSRWIAASEPARDLVGYSISEAYTEARRRAGLATEPR